MTAAPPIVGHEDVRRRLARAAAADALPGSLLLFGPPGVGRQRVGLWLAQLLVCEAPAAAGPCDACRPCRLALRLEHPDLHWFFPLPRPKNVSGPGKLAEALEDARAAELEARRTEPFRAVVPGEAAAIFLAQVQTLRRCAQQRPAMGSRKVFLVGDAEALVPQESSPEAANALLKVLEEPPPGTTLLLTARDPDALLPTIRSRLLPVRLRPLPIEDVRRFLVDARGADPAHAELAARLSQGSIGRALAFLPASNGDASPLEALRRQARDFLAAAADPGPGPRYTRALAQAPVAARGTFRDSLEFLALWIRDLAATAAGAGESVVNHDGAAFLVDLARRLPGAASGAARALAAVERARLLAFGNVNPQLTAAWLIGEVRGALADS